MFRKSFPGGRAFDATGASGMAYLASQLELLDGDVTKPLQDVTHPRDITVKFGGGFIEFITSYASSYGTTGGNQYGLQANDNTDIAIVQADLKKGNWRTFNWAAGIFVTYIDLKRMEAAKASGNPPPISLQELYDDAIASVNAKALDRLAYLGWLGYPGIINNPIVPEYTVAADSSSHTTWAYKILDSNGPTLILNDFNTALATTVENSGYNVNEGMGDTALIPWTQFQLLSAPMAIGGVGYESIIHYVEKNCVLANVTGKKLKIYPLPNPWITGQGSGATDRMVVYKNDEKNLYMQVPQPPQQAMMVPTADKGGGYQTIYNGCMSQVIWKRSQTAVYADGI